VRESFGSIGRIQICGSNVQHSKERFRHTPYIHRARAQKLPAPRTRHNGWNVAKIGGWERNGYEPFGRECIDEPANRVSAQNVPRVVSRALVPTF
jgi:hypothetical protein